MQAATYEAYGSPDVLEMRELAAPEISENEMLLRVYASPVTQGDRRLRAADYPGISALFGRLVTGLFRPRKPVPGSAFAGRVVAVGSAVTRFQVGQDVFGSGMHGAHAELMAVAEDSVIAPMPAGMSHAGAAALPYGAVTALTLLRDLGDVQPGQRVLIIGASGGVGRTAVQLAQHFGAEVTAVCSRRSFAAVRALGADHVIDHATEDFTENGVQYDVIFDTPDVSSFGQSRGSLTPTGRFLSIHMGVGVLCQMAWTALRGGQRAIFGMAMGSGELMDDVRALAEAGAIWPVINRRFPLAQVAEAHTHLEAGRLDGSVVLTVAAA
jgi:NADPH:quinone reductase-like Zn-dependent oxidoreductase